MNRPPPESLAPQGDQALLRIIATTDLHGHILPYDYYADRPVATHGLSRLARQIDTLRSGAQNSLLLDNGDFLQGNPLGDYIAEVRGLNVGDLHPMIAAMNALGYDVATLGNHEFNHGLDFLAAALHRAEFPVIAANVIIALGPHPLRDQWLRPPFVILDRVLHSADGTSRPLRIGLIGFLPPQITIWDRDHLRGRIVTRDIVATAQALVSAIKAEGADIIIALCHSGIGLATAEAGLENAAVPLAAIQGIDAVIAGHSHLVFPSSAFDGVAQVDTAGGTISGKPAVMAGCFGSHLGIIDLVLEPALRGWTVIATRSEARPIAPPGLDLPAATSAGKITRAVQADHDATLAHIRRPVGNAAHPLHSYFAVLPGDRALKLVADAQHWHLRTALQGTEFAGLPLLSAVAPFKMGGRGGPDHYTDVPSGELLLRHVADLYVHPNTICAVRIDGTQLKEWLERSASIFHRLLPGMAERNLLDSDAPFSGFDVIDGVAYTIDLSQPPRFGPHAGQPNPAVNRILDLSCDNRPVHPGDHFVIATNSYRANGGAGFPGADGTTIIHSEPTLVRDILRRYIERHSPVSPVASANWRFRPLPGLTALYDSSAKALPHSRNIAGLTLDPLPHPDPALARFRIRF